MISSVEKKMQDSTPVGFTSVKLMFSVASVFDRDAPPTAPPPLPPPPHTSESLQGDDVDSPLQRLLVLKGNLTSYTHVFRATQLPGKTRPALANPIMQNGTLFHLIIHQGKSNKASLRFFELSVELNVHSGRREGSGWC